MVNVQVVMKFDIWTVDVGVVREVDSFGIPSSKKVTTERWWKGGFDDRATAEREAQRLSDRWLHPFVVREVECYVHTIGPVSESECLRRGGDGEPAVPTGVGSTEPEEPEGSGPVFPYD